MTSPRTRATREVSPRQDRSLQWSPDRTRIQIHQARETEATSSLTGQISIIKTQGTNEGPLVGSRWSSPQGNSIPSLTFTSNQRRRTQRTRKESSSSTTPRALCTLARTGQGSACTTDIGIWLISKTSSLKRIATVDSKILPCTPQTTPTSQKASKKA